MFLNLCISTLQLERNCLKGVNSYVSIVCFFIQTSSKVDYEYLQLLNSPLKSSSCNSSAFSALVRTSLLAYTADVVARSDFNALLIGGGPVEAVKLNV